MTVEQVAARLAELCREEKFSIAQKELYADDAMSIEPHDIPGFERETKGLTAMMEKDRKFNAMIEARYGTRVSAPLIVGNVFAITLTMDIQLKGQERMTMSELGVYQVKDGKIISEQFFM